MSHQAPGEVSVAAVGSVISELGSLFHRPKSKEEAERGRDVFARLKTDFGRQQFEGPTGSTGGSAHLLFI